ESYNGLAKTNPRLALAITIAMLSFAGIPLTAGFVGKLMMFTNVMGEYKIILLILAVLNAAMGIYYYFRVIVSMYFKTEEREVIEVPVNYQIVFAVASVLILILGIYPGFVLGLF